MRFAVLAMLGVTAGFAAVPSQAAALNPLGAVCGVAGLASGVAKGLCTAAENGGRFLKAGKQLFSGRLGSAIKSILGQSSSGVSSKVTTGIALAAIGAWVAGGAKFALINTAHVLSQTTTPALGSSWFSSTYWSVAGISALLTLPFLFAAAVQALLASDLALLLRSALGYLPVALLGVAIAAPLTTLLLSASDQLSGVVSAAAGGASERFLVRASTFIGIATGVARSPFLVFLAALVTVGVGLALWLELLVRAAAVYVIVLLLPLAFAAFVWPARRMWLVRAVEILIALILSKFVIVAVLSLGGAALSHSFPLGLTGMLAGAALLGIGVCAPWALLRLLPVTEVASSAVGSLRGDLQGAGERAAASYGEAADRSTDAPRLPMPEPDWAPTTTAQMRRDLESSDAGAAEMADREPPQEDVAPLPTPSLGSAPSAGHANAASASADPPLTPIRRERSPGLAPMWQAENRSWDTLELGPGASWPPRVWTGESSAEADAAGTDEFSPAPPGPDARPPLGADASTAASEDPPIPPPQPTPDGHL